MILNETAVMEIEERASAAMGAMDDPEVARRYAERAAKADVPLLLEALRASYNSGGGGGDLGLLLRNALRDRVVRASARLQDDDKRSAELCDDVNILSVTVASVSGKGSVVIDIRLMVGDEGGHGH